jgi:hypothetical protein
VSIVRTVWPNRREALRLLFLSAAGSGTPRTVLRCARRAMQRRGRWADNRQLSVVGEGDAWHTAVTDRHGLTVAEGWGPTAELALARAVGAY